MATHPYSSKTDRKGRTKEMAAMMTAKKESISLRKNNQLYHCLALVASHTSNPPNQSKAFPMNRCLHSSSNAPPHAHTHQNYDNSIIKKYNNSSHYLKLNGCLSSSPLNKTCEIYFWENPEAESFGHAASLLFGLYSTKAPSCWP